MAEDTPRSRPERIEAERLAAQNIPAKPIIADPIEANRIEADPIESARIEASQFNNPDHQKGGWRNRLAANDPEKIRKRDEAEKAAGLYKELKSGGRAEGRGGTLKDRLGSIGKKNEFKSHLKKNFSLKKRVQVSLAASLITAGVGLGGGAGAFLIGPGQLIMFGEIFRDFSFGASDQQSEDFSNRLYRRLFVKNPGDRDLGAAGRRMANNAETAMKARGIEFDPPLNEDGTRGNRGYLKGIRTPEGYIDLGNNTDGISQRTRRRVMKKAILDSGVSRWRYYTSYRRVMQTRFRVKFKFFENRDRKVRIKAGEWFNEKFKKHINEGATDTDIRPSEGDEDSDDADRRAAQDGADTASEGAGDNAGTVSGESEGGNPISGRKKTAARLKKGLFSVVGFATLGCTIIALDDQAETIAKAQRYIPLIRLYNTYISITSQLLSLDIRSLAEVQEASKLLSETRKLDSEGKTVVEDGTQVTADKVTKEVTWIDGAPAKRAIGSKWKGQPDLRKDLSPDPNTLSSILGTLAGFFRGFPGMSPFCSAATSPAGGIILTVAGLATDFTPAGIASELAGFIAGEAFGDDITEAILGFLEPGLLDVTGDAINQAGMTEAGGIAANAEGELAGGGVPLTLDQSLALR